MVEVALDELPAPLALQIAKLQVAYCRPDEDRSVVEHVLPSGRRQELEHDVARGRCPTDDERRAALPAAERSVPPDVTFVTSRDEAIAAFIARAGIAVGP